MRGSGQPGDHRLPWVAARFEVRGRLGGGPHGDVFEAHDSHLGLRAAVKVIPASPDEAPRLAEALGVLIDTLRELNAPSLAAAYDVGLTGEDPGGDATAGGGIYVATELAPLGSVGAFPRAPLGLMAGWILELLDAAEACHSVGLTHGHIAPTNALIEAEPDGSLHASLADLGLAPVTSRRPPKLDEGIAQDVRDLALLTLDVLGQRGAVDWAVRRAVAPLAFRPDLEIPPPLRALLELAAATPSWGDARALRGALAPLASAGTVPGPPGVASTQAQGAVGAQPRAAAAASDATAEEPSGASAVERAPDLAPPVPVAASEVGAMWAAMSLATTRRAALDAVAAQAATQCGATGLVLYQRTAAGDAAPHASRGEAAPLDAPGVYAAARAVLAGAPGSLVAPGDAGTSADVRAAVVPFPLGENVEALSVCWPAPDGAGGAGAAREGEEALPPVGPQGRLSRLALLGAMGAAVAERASARQALLDETATRAALMDMARDALVLLGAGGVVRGLTATAADLLDIHREAAVGRELGSLRGLGSLGRVLRWARAVEDEVVAISGGQVLVRAQPVDTGAVVRLEPMKRGSRPASGSWQRRRGLEHVVGTDPALVAAVRQARRAATHSRPISIEGEPGTGRKLLAEAIHRTSARAEGPFLVFRAAAIPTSTHAQVLLGVDGQGAMGGGPRPGKLPIAHRGTLVIERPDCLPGEVQDVLTHVMAHGYGTPLGGGAKFPADVRIIAITERPLEEIAEEGRCAEELVRLLRANRVLLPPLRARRGDVPALLRHALTAAARDAGRATMEVAPEVLQSLSAYDWPGNVRELVQLADAWMTLMPPDATAIERVPSHIERALSLAL